MLEMGMLTRPKYVLFSSGGKREKADINIDKGVTAVLKRNLKLKNIKQAMSIFHFNNK